jgi:hypothetical protein
MEETPNKPRYRRDLMSTSERWFFFGIISKVQNIVSQVSL